MQWPERIESRPEVMGGHPVIRGTRITVSTILGFLAAGDSVEGLLASYPQLTQEDILACIKAGLRALEMATTSGRLKYYFETLHDLPPVTST